MLNIYFKQNSVSKASLGGSGLTSMKKRFGLDRFRWVRFGQGSVRAQFIRLDLKASHLL